METVLIPNNTTKVIPIGSKATDHIINITYEGNRGTLIEAGEIQIINKTSTATINSSSGGDNCGLALSTSVSSSNIFLIVVVDNSGGRVEFKYNVTKF